MRVGPSGGSQGNPLGMAIVMFIAVVVLGIIFCTACQVFS